MTEVPLTPSSKPDEAKPAEVNMIRLPVLTERDASTLNAIITAGVSAIAHSVKFPIAGNIILMFNRDVAEEYMCSDAHARHLPCPDHQPNKARMLAKDPTFESRIFEADREIENLGKKFNEILIPFINDFRHRELELFPEAEE